MTFLSPRVANPKSKDSDHKLWRASTGEAYAKLASPGPPRRRRAHDLTVQLCSFLASGETGDSDCACRSSVICRLPLQAIGYGCDQEYFTGSRSPDGVALGIRVRWFVFD
jgi:hypothetical protein